MWAIIPYTLKDKKHHEKIICSNATEARRSGMMATVKDIALNFCPKLENFNQFITDNKLEKAKIYDILRKLEVYR